LSAVENGIPFAVFLNRLWLWLVGVHFSSSEVNGSIQVYPFRPSHECRYVLTGSSIRTQMGGGQRLKIITAPAPRGGIVTINKVRYVRQ
jgi:hypothetical protein